VVRRLEETAEWACDEAATRDGIKSTGVYVRALLALGREPREVHSLLLSASGGRLYGRIKRILETGKEKDSRMKKIFVVAVVGLVFVANSVNVMLVAQTSDDQPVAEAVEENRTTLRESKSDKPKSDAEDTQDNSEDVADKKAVNGNEVDANAERTRHILKVINQLNFEQDRLKARRLEFEANRKRELQNKAQTREALDARAKEEKRLGELVVQNITLKLSS